MRTKASTATPVRPSFEEVEPRILFSADGIAAAGTVVAEDEAPALEANLEPVADARNGTESESSGVEHEAPLAVRHELVFVDTDTPDYQNLIDELSASGDASRQLDIVLLDNTRDGITQITEILADYQDLDAVHILSHGENGAVDLGATQLASQDVDRHAEAIRSWSAAFASDGDILIYGCNLAEGDDGRTLVNQLAALTGTDVADLRRPHRRQRPRRRLGSRVRGRLGGCR